MHNLINAKVKKDDMLPNDALVKLIEGECPGLLLFCENGKRLRNIL